MVYLDYSATTPISEEVLKTYEKVSKDYFSNTNSLHLKGKESKKLLEEALNQIGSFFNVNKEQVVITSGATEANNLALKGYLEFHHEREEKILISPFEHSSIRNQSLNFTLLKIDDEGLIDIDDLKEKLDTKKYSLVSIALVDSELGIRQEIEKLGKLIKEYPKVVFHVDATQGIGKTKADFKDVDLISLSSHKIYGPKGIGALIVKKNVGLISQIEGGDSQIKYRSGTIPLELVVSFAKALKIVKTNEDKNIKHVNELHSYLMTNLNKLPVKINSTKSSISHIVNFSHLNIQAETLVNALSLEDIYISTRSACSFKNDYSINVYNLTKDLTLAKNSVRVSISHLTTKEEIDKLTNNLDKVIKKLDLRS